MGYMFKGVGRRADLKCYPVDGSDLRRAICSIAVMSWDTLCLPERIDANPPSAIASVALGILLELRVADPIPPLDTPVVSHQLQQCFWGHPDAREKQMAGVEGGPFRSPVVTTSTIRLVLSHSSRMCPGASFASSVQVMSRLCPSS
jgi:hypothetical protein